MRKTPAAAADSDVSRLRGIPSVERLLSSSDFAPSIAEFGREAVKNAITGHLDSIRAARGVYETGAAVAAVESTLRVTTSSTLRRVINGSGVIIHTNLGRSPIDPAVWRDAANLVEGYSNLEFDLAHGERGKREEHLTELCRSLFGCEAAVLANNNAAGTLLLLAAVAAGKEVIVSRGELVEIGGAFRVPDVIQQGGAKLREVGTTNRTRARDYAEAVTKKTAAILRVHRSNFDIVGFTETPSVDELVEVARKKKLPMLYDEGSGRIVDLARYGFERGETLRELIAKGIDAVTCSTDKLIGATQGGLIIGREEIVGKVRKHPLMRAFRAGKESYGVIAATLRAFATGKHEERIAIYRMLAMPPERLRTRAAEMTRGAKVRITESDCALGGGTTPTETIHSVAIELPGNASELQAKFLRFDPPIVGRIVNDRFTIEVRTLLDEDFADVARAVREMSGA